MLGQWSLVENHQYNIVIAMLESKLRVIILLLLTVYPRWYKWPEQSGSPMYYKL